MAIEITSDTVVKVLIRRGLESERTFTTFTEGELGYSIDTQRLFIGDGITAGGVVAGNKFLGITPNKDVFTSVAQVGDTVFQSANNTLYGYNGLGELEGWQNIHPIPFIGTSPGLRSIEQAPANGTWRVSNELLGDGFALVYEGSSRPLNTIQKLNNRIDFDSRYLSLCANPVAPYDGSSFYFGNIGTKYVPNNLDATVNIANSLFVNGDQPTNTYQIQLLAESPYDSNASLIYTNNANLNLDSSESTKLLSQGQAGIILTYNSTLNLLTTVLSSQRNGSLGFPNFDFKGVPVFRDNVIFDTSSNVTMLGNLSVFGDTTYFETTVTTTSALSVINYNRNESAMVVAQLSFDGAPFDQTIARFEEGTVYTPSNIKCSVLAVRENQFVGIGVTPNINYSTFGANLVVSGASLFRPHPGFLHDNDGWGGHIVDMRAGSDVKNGSIEFYTAGDAQILFSNPGGNITFEAGGSTKFVTINGNLQCSDDVIAFSLSDIKYKNNIKKIDSALDKLDKISGVEFEWNSDSPYEGRDIGVLAQDVEKVLPEIVTTRSNGAKAVRYEKLVPLIIEAIKELKDRK
jgi:hypothetical protein